MRIIRAKKHFTQRRQPEYVIVIPNKATLPPTNKQTNKQTTPPSPNKTHLAQHKHLTDLPT